MRIFENCIGPGTMVTFAALALALGAGNSCARDDTGGPRELTREVFIETYVQILTAQAAASDSADARARRAGVLARRNVSPADLEAFARRYADDPKAMADIWGEIERRLRETPRADTLPRGDEDR
ncbi:MAG: hypothetical protein HY702_06930 [Gemmatimonadetes bacterium]|nr:hypothetical protein [Gemmatimonadota bacterium]